MRTYTNGTLRMGDNMPDYPPLNSERIPLINPPPPQIHRLVDPERLFREFSSITVVWSIAPRVLQFSETITMVMHEEWLYGAGKR